SFPLNVAARGMRGGLATFRDPQSSQFVSAILMAGALARGDVMINVTGPMISGSYVRMTLSLMERFGAAVVEQDLQKFIVPGLQRYTGQEIQIEPDASAASYFFAAAAITGGGVEIDGLGRQSVQGDIKFIHLLEKLGCRVHQTPHATIVEGPSEG